MIRTSAMRLAGLTACLLLARPGLAADGDLDPTFGLGGKVVTSFDSVPAASCNAMALQPDGKIITAGWVYNVTGLLGWAVARHNSDGSLDPTFDFDGRVRTEFFGSNDSAEAVAVQQDGKVVVAGTVENGLQRLFAVARYLPGGAPDPSFDGDGKVVGSFFGSAKAISLQPDGKIVVAGSGYRSVGNPDIAILRYNADGTPDSTFGTGGTVYTDVSGREDLTAALLVLPGGKLLVVGTTTTNTTNHDFAVVRYNPDGSPDSTFGDGGIVTHPFTDVATSAVLQPDGKIVVSGGLPPGGEALSVFRLLPDGSLDPGFGDGGVSGMAFPGFDEIAFTVAVQSDGKVVAAGTAHGPAVYDFAVARLNPDGRPDQTFGPSGTGVMTDFFGMNDGINALLIQVDGKILAAGTVVSGPTWYMALARYLASPDSPAPSRCPRSYGYWRSHLEEWPVSSLTLGSQSYGTTELTALLHSPAKGDASVILARQLIAAKLNLAAGAGSKDLEAVVAVADGLLAGFIGRLPYDVSPSSSAGHDLVKTAGRLSSASNRGRPGCDEVNGPK
jgi:uncharacterized delta-60 repeat protein